jgi:hypothetical protein
LRDEWLGLASPFWQQRGIVTQDFNKNGQTVLAVRNVLQDAGPGT